MKKLRIAVLLHKGLVPPDSLRGFKAEEIEEWKVEYDVISALKKLRHNIKPVEMYGELTPLRETIEEYKPHIAFNLIEEFPDYPLFDQHVISYLEMKKVPYTGCNPRGLMLAKDKALSKKILFYHDIKTPKFRVYHLKKKIVEDDELNYPLFVKSVSDDGSIGISKSSLVKNFKQLKKRVEFIHERTGTAAIAEEFIEGREIYVGVMGNDYPVSFTPWELLIQNGNGESVIATSRLKWNLKYQKASGVETKAAKLSAELKNEFHKTALSIYKTLMFSGYARLDFRLTEDDTIYLIEANANPHIASDEDFARSAKHDKISYPELIQKIINYGLRNDPLK